MGRVEYCPYRIETLESTAKIIWYSWFDPQADPTCQIWWQSIQGRRTLGKWVNIMYCDFFFLYLFLFSGMRRDQNLWRILTHNGSKTRNYERCVFCGSNYLIFKFDPLFAPKRQNLAQKVNIPKKKYTNKNFIKQTPPPSRLFVLYKSIKYSCTLRFRSQGSAATDLSGCGSFITFRSSLLNLTVKIM